MPLGGRGHRDGGYVTNTGICTEESGKNCGVHCNTPYLRVVYQGGADDGAQLEPEVLGSVPQKRLGG